MAAKTITVFSFLSYLSRSSTTFESSQKIQNSKINTTSTNRKRNWYLAFVNFEQIKSCSIFISLISNLIIDLYFKFGNWSRTWQIRTQANYSHHVKNSTGFAMHGEDVRPQGQNLEPGMFHIININKKSNNLNNFKIWNSVFTIHILK